MTLCHRVHWRRVPDSSSLARASVHDVYCANASNFFYIMVSFPVAWSCVIAGSNPILYAYSLFTKKDKHADKWQIQYFVNQTMWSKRWVRCPTVRMVRSLCFNVLWIQILMIFFFTQSFWEIGSRRGVEDTRIFWNSVWFPFLPRQSYLPKTVKLITATSFPFLERLPLSPTTIHP